MTEWCCAGHLKWYPLHFSMVGRGCWLRPLLPSMHCSPPTPLHRLTEFWFDRYENNFKKSHHCNITKPTADGFVLFDRKGQRNHGSTVAKAPISRVLCTQTEKPCLPGELGVPWGPLVGARI